jgi:F0F1-type ATP synthase membrane subunit c/vacuolar-type H+-ATPase subunit K
LNSQALATLGMAYLQQGQPEQAVALWQRFLQVVPSGSMAVAVQGALEHAQSLLAGDGVAAGVQVLVSALSDDIAADADIYIVARNPATGTLVAIDRYQANAMPPALRLTEQHRLAEDGPSLADLTQVEVIAFAVPAGQPLSAATHRSSVVQSPTQGANAQAALTLQPL